MMKLFDTGVSAHKERGGYYGKKSECYTGSSKNCRDKESKGEYWKYETTTE